MIKAPSDDALRSRPIGFAVFFRLMMPSIDVRSSTLGTVTIRCIPTLSTNVERVHRVASVGVFLVG
jgi:hypothetical protein